MTRRPAWRDAAQYSKFLNARLDLLAWEFIRRNPAYCDDASRFFSDDRGEKQTNSEQVWQAHFAAEWGLHTPKHPDEDYYKTDLDEWPIFIGWDFRDFVSYAEWRPSCGPKVSIPVDLSLPLEAIEEQVVGTVRALRAAGIEHGSFTPVSARTQSTRVYVEHLRILDAVAEGSTIAEIGEVLHPGAINDPEERQRDKRIRAAHKAALKMQAEGWRMLAGVPC